MLDRHRMYVDEKLRELQVDHLSLMDNEPGLIEWAVTGIVKFVVSALRGLGKRLIAQAEAPREQPAASEIEQRPLTS